jgi:hypothetical protein
MFAAGNTTAIAQARNMAAAAKNTTSEMPPRGSPMSPESLEFWKSLFEIIGVFLLLLTFLAGAGVVWFSRKVNEVQAKQLKQFDERLTDAKTELGKQQERAANAEASIALAEQHAAEANLRAEREKIERIKLEEDLSPRSFNGSTEAIKRLSSLRGTTVLLEYSLDLECKATAERIAFVLSEAGWTIKPKPNNDPNAVFREGVVVGYVGEGGVGVAPIPIAVRLPFDKTPPIKTAGEILLDELNNSGMDAHSLPGVGRTGEAVYVYVGFRPSPESKRALKIEREIQRRITDSIGTSKPPDLMDLVEQRKKLRLGGARLQLPTR